jgi:hypothetical protein
MAMNNIYQTHQLFRYTDNWPRERTITTCRQIFGENDIMQPYVERDWITDVDGVYIRKDIDHPVMTFFLLKSQLE